MTISTFRKRRARETCEAFGKSYDTAYATWRTLKATDGYIVSPRIMTLPRAMQTAMEGRAFETFIFAFCENQRHRRLRRLPHCFH